MGWGMDGELQHPPKVVPRLLEAAHAAPCKSAYNNAESRAIEPNPGVLEHIIHSSGSDPSIR
jgi:hypothetical protein